MRKRITWASMVAFLTLSFSIVPLGVVQQAQALGPAVTAGDVTTATNQTLVENTNVDAPGCTSGQTTLPNVGFIGCGSSGLLGFGTLVGVEGSAALVGVLGHAGDGGYGVRGDSANGLGVYGTSATLTGVYGASDAGKGVNGLSTESVGVFGRGGSNGVEGHSSNPNATGVYGENDGGGFGVAGRGNVGVFGESGNIGVRGNSNNGTGMLAQSLFGTALEVQGRASFDTGGVAVVPPTKKKVTVTLAGVTASDFVLATVQGNGTISVVGAKAAAGQFTIFVSQVAPASPPLRVAYFVLSP